MEDILNQINSSIISLSYNIEDLQNTIIEKSDQLIKILKQIESNTG